MSTSLTELKERATRELAPVPMGFGNSQSFELVQRAAKALSRSTLVPKLYQARAENDHVAVSNCMIALNMANRMGADPLMVMQNLYPIHGTPSWSAKFLIATINVSGRFSALRYEWKGEEGKNDFGCRAWAIEKETGERLNGIWITWQMVHGEGWSKKDGSKWRTMPEQMFIYRAAAFWQRAYAPEMGMGLQTTEELEDVIDITPKETSSVGLGELTRELAGGAQQGEHRNGDGISAEAEVNSIEPPQGEDTADQTEAAYEAPEVVTGEVVEDKPKNRRERAMINGLE